MNRMIRRSHLAFQVGSSKLSKFLYHFNNGG